jgi:hypothetical protein
MTDYDSHPSMSAYARVYEMYPEAIEADIAALAMAINQDRMIAAFERGEEIEAQHLLIDEIPLLFDQLTQVRALAVRTGSVDRIERCDWLATELNRLIEQLDQARGSEET